LQSSGIYAQSLTEKGTAGSCPVFAKSLTHHTTLILFSWTAFCS
jgi:hypothetical protein